MSFKTITGSTKGQLIKGIPPVGGGGGGGTITSITSVDGTETILNGAGPAVDISVAYIPTDTATLQGMIGGFAPNRWYQTNDFQSKLNTDDMLYVHAIGTDFLSIRAIYFDSNMSEYRECKYDLSADLIVEMTDLRGNYVYHSGGIQLVNFPWDNSSWSRNRFINSIVQGDEGDSVFINNRFDSSSVIINESSITLNDNEIRLGTNLELNQNSLFMKGNIIQSSGKFTFAADSFWDSFVNNTILCGGDFTNAGGDSRSSVYGCKIMTGGPINTATEISNLSLYGLTSDEYINNIFSTLDLNDGSIFGGGNLGPLLFCSYARNFILTNNVGTSITSIGLVNGSRARFYPASGTNYKFTHVAVASIGASGELIRTAGAGDLNVIGRANALDYVEYELGFMGNAACVLINYVAAT